MERNFLIDVYKKEIRCSLEYAVPVWHSSLTKKNSDDIERVQKAACAIILGDSFETYRKSCSVLNLEDLKTRREKMCIKFAKKEAKNSNSLFKEIHKPYQTRNNHKFEEIYCRTKTFQQSSLPYLTKVLNENVQFFTLC